MAAETDTYITLCFRCHTIVHLTPEQMVIREAEQVCLGIIHVAFCPPCREAALRMVDELGG